MADQPPYRLSRAALRNKYGSRAIDASSKQSALDDTPSGRAKRLEQSGYNPDQAKAQDNEDWADKFTPQTTTQKAVLPKDLPLYDQVTQPDQAPLNTETISPFTSGPMLAAFNPKQSLLPEAIGDPSAMLEFLPPPDPTIGRAPVFAPRKKSYGSSLFGGSSLFT